MQLSALRKITLFGLSLVGSIVLSSCSLRLNDKMNKVEHSVNVGGGCLSQAGDVLDRFYQGTLSQEKHDSFYDCTNRALTTFLSYADGKSRDQFEPEELANFLSTYFLQGKVIHPALVKESMHLKSALVGGAAESIRRDELLHIMEILGHMRKATGAIRPFMPYSASSFLARGFGTEEFEAALKVFVTSINEFGDRIKSEQNSYSLDHLKGLIQELQTFLYPEAVPLNHWSCVTLRLMAVLPSAKTIFIAPPRDQITSADWSRIYRLAPRYYGSLLRLEYYWKVPYTTVYGAGLRGMEKVFQDSLATFDYVIDQQPGQRITSEEIQDLVKSLAEQNMLPVSPETVGRFVKILFGKILGDSSSSETFAVTKHSINRLRTNLRFLFEGLRVSEALYRTRFGDFFFNGSLKRGEITSAPSQTLLEATSLKNSLSLEAVEAIKKTPVEVRTAFSGNTFNVVIQEPGSPVSYSYSHTITMHLLRSMNRLLIEAYGGSKARGLSESQVGALISDIFPFMIEMEVFDPSLQESISKRLFEASVFLYSSDGDNGLTMSEALEFESLILSTLSNASRAHYLLSQSCNEKMENISNVAPINANCYRKNFIRNAANIWNYLPGFGKYFNRLGPDESYEIYDLMQSFLRKGKSANAEYTKGDTQAFILLPYYVEMLFSRFDRDGNGEIDNDEANRAYPVFRPFLSKKATEKGLNKPEDHYAVFNFLLAYRELPTEDKWEFAIRRYLLGPKKFSVNRSQVVEIFAKLLSL